MRRKIYILLGGVLPNGIDGFVSSAGLLTYAKGLGNMPDTDVSIYTWGDWEKVVKALRTPGQEPHNNVLLGYSGGGMAAAYVQEVARNIDIRLVVLWDPSPRWTMAENPFYSNVERVVTFFNENPMMPSWYGMLGGGKPVLAKANKTTVLLQENISMQHLLVQTNADVKNKTTSYIRKYS